MQKRCWSISFLQIMALCFSESIKICLMQIVSGADVPAKLGTESVQWGHKEDGSSLCSAKILADHRRARPDVKFQSLSVLVFALYFSISCILVSTDGWNKFFSCQPSRVSSWWLLLITSWGVFCYFGVFFFLFLVGFFFRGRGVYFCCCFVGGFFCCCFILFFSGKKE